MAVRKKKRRVIEIPELWCVAFYFREGGRRFECVLNKDTGVITINEFARAVYKGKLFKKRIRNARKVFENILNRADRNF